MSKTKVCSRNEIIKFVHDVTGWEYSKCRSKLKECNWNWMLAIYPDGFNVELKLAIDNFVKSAMQCAESIRKLFEEVQINV